MSEFDLFFICYFTQWKIGFCNLEVFTFNRKNFSGTTHLKFRIIDSFTWTLLSLLANSFLVMVSCTLLCKLVEAYFCQTKSRITYGNKVFLIAAFLMEYFSFCWFNYWASQKVKRIQIERIQVGNAFLLHYRILWRYTFFCKIVGSKNCYLRFKLFLLSGIKFDIRCAVFENYS